MNVIANTLFEISIFTYIYNLHDMTYSKLSDDMSKQEMTSQTITTNNN